MSLDPISGRIAHQIRHKLETPQLPENILVGGCLPPTRMSVGRNGHDGSAGPLLLTPSVGTSHTTTRGGYKKRGPEHPRNPQVWEVNYRSFLPISTIFFVGLLAPAVFTQLVANRLRCRHELSLVRVGDGDSTRFFMSSMNFFCWPGSSP